MADYPSSIKTFTNPGQASTQDTPGVYHDVQHGDANDEINAIETELGVAPKTITDNVAPAASPTSVAQFLDMVATHLKAISGGANWYTTIGTSLSSIVSTVTSHLSDTTTHGTTGDIVGTSDSQVLTNKDLTATSNSFTAASTTQSGVSEIATSTETTTGTDATRVISPDGLAGSDYGKRVVGIQVFPSGNDVTTGDGAAFFRVPSILNGYNLVGVAMNVYTAGTTGTTDVQIRNVTDAVDILSTKLTIDSTETDTSTAAVAAVIDGTKDDVATGDKIAIDVDATSTTKAKGLYVELTFQLP